MMSKMTVFLISGVNHTLYQVTLNSSHGIDYGVSLEFSIQLFDEEGNSEIYPETQPLYSTDIIDDYKAPEISIDDVFASTTDEGRTFVYVHAEDPFGEERCHMFFPRC